MSGRPALDDEERTPENEEINKSLLSMFTFYLSRQMGRVSVREFLKLFTSNTEIPYLIWDNRTRAELQDFVEKQQESHIKHGECVEGFGNQFTYSVLDDELMVGNIYVRVFNEQPTFVLEDSGEFAASLIEFIGKQAEYLQSVKLLPQEHANEALRLLHIQHAESSLQALENVIKNNTGVETRTIGHFILLFSLLSIEGSYRLKELALMVILSVTGAKKCINNIAEVNTLHFLLMIMPLYPKCHGTILEILLALSSNTSIIKECIQKGGLIYLLDIFCNANTSEVREATAALFSKMIGDKLTGPKVRIILTKFLPLIFLDAMRDNPEAAVHMFENIHENPELIWNDEARNKVSNTILSMRNQFNKEQQRDPLIIWKLPDHFTVAYSEIEGEIEVGGVYLRLFINQPSWVLRRPKEFLIAILDKFCLLCEMESPDSGVLESVTTAVSFLLINHPALTDQIPPLGHIPRIFACMSPKSALINKSCVTIMIPMTDSDVCVRTIAKCKSIEPLMTAMKSKNDILLPACEAISKMLDRTIPELVTQALDAGLVHFLIGMLEDSLIGLENLSATKAQIVKVLKTLSQDIVNGQSIIEILDSSTVWNIYRDQKHDLFLTETKISGHLMGPGIAGYLTAPVQNNVMPDVPPPMSPPDEDQAD